MQHKAALLGNPNSGKTLLFNILTGSNQKVANFPGVTVEKKSGLVKDTNIELVDLPGIYSLSPYSQEERVSRDFVLSERPDFIIDIIDGTNIERNLYLTLQLLEMEIPMVVIINMVDELERLKIKINYTGLSDRLGVPVIPISAKKQQNIEAVREIIHQFIHIGKKPLLPVYDRGLEELKADVAALLPEKVSAFVLMKILEQDEEIVRRSGITSQTEAKITDRINEHIKTLEDLDEDTYIAAARYGYIEGILKETVSIEQHQSMHKTSDKIDRFVANRFLGIPIFIAVMLLIFQITFGPVGAFLQDIITFIIDRGIVPGLTRVFVSQGAPEWVRSLVLDGIVGGVGSVLTFLPQIALLFVLLTLLEDSGYMSRVAFIMDKMLQKIGLSGKAFVPMLLGFGCTTPAVMAARTLDNEKDRKMTMMLSPFMSCSAKMPIYVMFAGLFFKERQGLVVSSMYFIGIAVAILSGILLKNTLFKGVFSPFVVELPPYRLPSGRSVFKQSGEKIYGFIIRAGTVIFAMSIVIWVLQSFTITLSPVEDPSMSILSGIGRLIAPLFAPLGFSDWREAVALLMGIIAKEAVVSSMSVLYGSAASVQSTLASAFTPLSAYAFMVFSLLYMSCIASFATIRHETRSFKWPLGIAAYQTAVAYIVSLLIYQIGSIFI